MCAEWLACACAWVVYSGARDVMGVSAVRACPNVCVRACAVRVRVKERGHTVHVLNEQKRRKDEDTCGQTKRMNDDSLPGRESKQIRRIPPE